MTEILLIIVLIVTLILFYFITKSFDDSMSNIKSNTRKN